MTPYEIYKLSRDDVGVAKSVSQSPRGVLKALQFIGKLVGRLATPSV